MAAMDGFDHILNWKLKAGSHPFPGKHGGTCINEAALVAAGFEYRPICRVREMPECFSRPICRFAMWLNDMVSDTERQRLLPFVTLCDPAGLCGHAHGRMCPRALHRHPRWPRFHVRARAGHPGGVLAIGRRADSLEPETVTARMAGVQSLATTA